MANRHLHVTFNTYSLQHLVSCNKTKLLIGKNTAGNNYASHQVSAGTALSIESLSHVENKIQTVDESHIH